MDKSSLTLETIECKDRTIAYSTIGPKDSPCILYFYPGGGNRRMLLSFSEYLPHAKLVCVNRPGKGETSPSKDHLTTAIKDAISVLDALGIDKVSVLCMCAGTPFAMAFSLQYPERFTGQFMGISSWILPADCGYENTKVSFYLGTHVPFVSHLVGSIMSSIGMSLSSFPSSWTAKALRSKLSPEEQEAFDAKYPDCEEFVDGIKRMQGERGGQGADVAVLLDSAGRIDYEKLGGACQNITFWHGTNDSMVPFQGAEWLVEEVPGAILNKIPEGTHEGLMFLLHPSIVDSLKTFGT